MGSPGIGDELALARRMFGNDTMPGTRPGFGDELEYARDKHLERTAANFLPFILANNARNYDGPAPGTRAGFGDEAAFFKGLFG